MSDCPHPLNRREKAMLNGDDPDYAYCLDCASVLHYENGVWVAQPTGITKTRYYKR